MALPTPEDYEVAVQNPARFFADPDLKQGRAVLNRQDLPLVYSGNFANVYRFQGPDLK